MGKQSGQYLFKKHDSIGANDAENDDKFLESCFEDTGDLKELVDVASPRRIVLGRTGSGKTCLVLQLKRQFNNVICIRPEDLSLNFITNTTVIRDLANLGVSLDPFFKLLWRHVLAVTLLQARFPVQDESSLGMLLERITNSIPFVNQRGRLEKQRREKALQYLTDWGASFWEGFNERTKEVTRTFSNSVENALNEKMSDSIKIGPNALSFKFADSTGGEYKAIEEMTVEEKTVIQKTIQPIVKEVLLKELTGLMDLIQGAFEDASDKFYITIDRLDEDWVDHAVRFRLIKALIEVSKEFGGVKNTKVITCLRVDLLEKVFRETRKDSNTQEEKFSSLYLHLNWNAESLKNLLDKRVSHLIKDAYTKHSPGIDDIIPDKLRIGAGRHSVKTLDYIIDRTWKRPRDVIEFLNICIEKSQGKAKISSETIVSAESEYSKRRFSSIVNEWKGLYPHLEDVIFSFLHKRKSNLLLKDFTDADISDWALRLASSQTHVEDEITQIAQQIVDERLTPRKGFQKLVNMMFSTSIIGVKTLQSTSAMWAEGHSSRLSDDELIPESHLYIHPGLWKALEVTP